MLFTYYIPHQVCTHNTHFIYMILHISPRTHPYIHINIRVTLTDLQLLLASLHLMPAVFSRELVVRTWQNLIAQRAPKIGALKRKLRAAQTESSGMQVCVRVCAYTLCVCMCMSVCIYGYM